MGMIRDLIDAYQTEADRRETDPYNTFTGNDTLLNIVDS